MEDEEQDEKETNPDVDHSKNPLLAWQTRREEWANTPELKKFVTDFEHWIKTSEGKENVINHNKKSEIIREFFTEKNIEVASAEDFKNVYGKLYARRIDTSPDKPSEFVQNKFIKANGGLESFRSKLLQFIDPKKSHDEKFEYAIKNIKGFADATASEILTDMFPQDCFVWNDKVIMGIQILQIQRLVPKNSLKEKKSILLKITRT